MVSTINITVFSCLADIRSPQSILAAFYYKWLISWFETLECALDLSLCGQHFSDFNKNIFCWQTEEGRKSERDPSNLSPLPS